METPHAGIGCKTLSWLLMQGNSQKPGLSAFTSSCQVDMDPQMDAPHYSALLIVQTHFFHPHFF